MGFFAAAFAWFARLLDDIAPFEQDEAVLSTLVVAIGATTALAGVGLLLPRRWSTRATWGVVLVSGLGLVVAVNTWSLRSQLAGWVVRDVGADGRDLRVDVLAEFACGFDAQVLVLRQTAEIVELEGRATPVRCDGVGEGLIDHGLDPRISPVTVHLDRPVGDARIVGRGQITRR